MLKRLLITGAAGGLGKVARQRLSHMAEVLRLSDIADLGPAGPRSAMSERRSTSAMCDSRWRATLPRPPAAPVISSRFNMQSSFEKVGQGHRDGRNVGGEHQCHENGGVERPDRLHRILY